MKKRRNAGSKIFEKLNFSILQEKYLVIILKRGEKVCINEILEIILLKYGENYRFFYRKKLLINLR